MVATPIGNLEDITYRAVRILREVESVACEDTRVTQKLLARYDINKSLMAIHHHSAETVIENILKRVEEGESLAYVCDAGTPGVSDPGNKLVELAVARGITVVPIPGASAVTAILSVAGIDTQQFCFLGFVPHKKGRKTFFLRVTESQVPVVYYDSVHRIVKNLTLLAETCPDMYVLIGRELTKQFEEIVRGSVAQALTYFKEHPEKIKGEFVVVGKNTKL